MTTYEGSMRLVVLWEQEIRALAAQARSVGPQPADDATEEEHKAWFQRVYHTYKAAYAAVCSPMFDSGEPCNVIVCNMDRVKLEQPAALAPGAAK